MSESSAARVRGGEPSSTARDPHGELAETIGEQLTRLLAVARRIVGSEEQALDAVQEAFVTLWRERPEAERRIPWLVRTVIHRSLHARRSAARRRRWEEEAARDAGLAGPCGLCDAERELLGAELRGEIARALSGLDESQRRVFALREIEGLEYEEIAVALAIPIGTVRSRLHRARRALQEALREWA